MTQGKAKGYGGQDYSTQDFPWECLSRAQNLNRWCGFGSNSSVTTYYVPMIGPPLAPPPPPLSPPPSPPPPFAPAPYDAMGGTCWVLFAPGCPGGDGRAPSTMWQIDSLGKAKGMGDPRSHLYCEALQGILNSWCGTREILTSYIPHSPTPPPPPPIDPPSPPPPLMPPDLPAGALSANDAQALTQLADREGLVAIVAVGASALAVCACCALVGFVYLVRFRERRGQPIFKPLEDVVRPPRLGLRAIVPKRMGEVAVTNGNVVEMVSASVGAADAAAAMEECRDVPAGTRENEVSPHVY